jgi:bifunctional enzyme CysN/CysC
MNFLETVYIGSDRNFQDFRFPVQIVLRPNQDFRGFAGTISSGIIRVGEEVMALPSRKTSRIREIVTADGKLEEAFVPMSVTLTLEDEIDVSRGDMIVRPGNVPRLEQRFDANIVWMSTQPMVPGRQYMFKHTTRTVPGNIQTLRYRIDVNTLHRVDAPALNLNEIGRVNITLAEPFACDRYRRNRSTGAFIVIDRITCETVGAGMIIDRQTSESRRDHWDDEPQSETLVEFDSKVSPNERSARYGQNPVTVLFTGLPGAGKSTTAFGVERALFEQGRSAVVLDGQNLRMGINRDLGFSPESRSENVRRCAEIARLFNDAGLIAPLSLVAPSGEFRQRAADVVGAERFLVVHLNAPAELCAQRNAGQREAAEPGALNYEAPKQPDLVLDTDQLSPAECVERVLALLGERGIIR